MSNEEIRVAVIDSLKRVAPEADSATLDPKVEFRDQLDIDSMDFLTFVIGLHESTGIDIPERDYPKLSSLDGAVEYLAARVPAA
jgi:acyl carrier protein